MNQFVMDSSVAVKRLSLFKAEPLTNEASRFLDRWSRGEIELLVPDLFWLEVANILWKVTKRGLCRPEEANAAYRQLEEQRYPTFASGAIVGAALDLAHRYSRTAYDSLYVALALEIDGLLVTADEKLANALAAHLPVKWLGAM